jgi:hypothetical protein
VSFSLGPAVDANEFCAGSMKLFGFNLPGGPPRPVLIHSHTYSNGYTYELSGVGVCRGNTNLPTHLRICFHSLTPTFLAGSFIKVYGK